MQSWKWPTLLLAIVLAVSIGLIATSGRQGNIVAPNTREHDVTTWSPPDSLPLSDARAAALVTPQPEVQPANHASNEYVPTSAQLAAFRADQSIAAARGYPVNPLTRYVTGRSGIKDPSTDSLIQWASHKWGIPTDWIRAQMVVESQWRQSARGDLVAVDARWYRTYPRFTRVANTDRVYQSAGIAQEKWRPDGSVGAGTEPLRWESTAFNLDYYAATVRYYYDGDCSWCTAGYAAGQAWRSIGAWYSPQPWGNAGSRQYIREVRTALAQEPWTQPGL